MTIPLDPRPSPLPDGSPWPSSEPEPPDTERPPRVVELPFMPKQPTIVSTGRDWPPAA